MKTSFLALLTFAASVLATPLLASRQLESQADALDQLTELVKVHTANINTTTAAVQDNPTLAQQNEACRRPSPPDFDAINGRPDLGHRPLWPRVSGTTTTTGGGDDACGQDSLIAKVQTLVWEVAGTLKFVIVKLGLGE
ncbi:predicted protein [Chaetomium globosum CBS 148.51]|uniref:Uncharacterized protein n=1 Tax=Chaetomium globosum (strain ATCC 6205 / CBS 148.51 / DSM 1962 / NBRC 6347 / NRRL 1970) TaxID=306901 RepID=Q2GTD4_CHAGB|nr:uncharacterized protein CHGG_08770 [Chaetomium globosum CBS 148.51]EAQ84756.1 predicted protein [Chaetomium globosum CBS 148.51]